MLRTYQDIFDEVYLLNVPMAGNKILLALPRVLKLNEEDIEARAFTLDEIRKMLASDDIIDLKTVAGIALLQER